MPYKREIVVTQADYQCGYRFGVFNPDTVFDPQDEQEDDWQIVPTATQELLWKNMLSDKREVEHLAGRDPVTLLFVGDAAQGTVLPYQDLLLGRLSDQVHAASEVLGLWVAWKNVVRARLIKGTGSHSMYKGSVELMVARDLRKTYHKDVRAWYHLQLTLHGVEWDVSHKGPKSWARSWLKANNLRWYVKSLMEERLKAWRKPPDAVLRAHYHDFDVCDIHEFDAAGRLWRTWGAICPAYAIMMDDYTRSATESKQAMHSGTLAWEVIDGKIRELHPFVHVFDIPRREVIGGKGKDEGPAGIPVPKEGRGPAKVVRARRSRRRRAA